MISVKFTRYLSKVPIDDGTTGLWLKVVTFFKITYRD